jgi:dTDP-4-amino-4,6-dideoxygalactose transaminase
LKHSDEWWTSSAPAHSVGRNVQIPAFVNLYACEIGDETRRLGYTPDAFPIAGNLDEEFLSLPMLPELTKSKSKYAARCVGEVVGAGAMV